ncbi:glycosyltransferase family 4 protein [Enterovibrio sp. 27052020O]|uniref:glycosyltransferase family 4 protein n=1 Tax=Enterovibrio sp. 27052020O TaxID=3241166 RepID=UPI00389032E9
MSKKRILLIDDNFHDKENGAPLFSMEYQFLEKRGYEVYTLSFGDNDALINDNQYIVDCGISNKLVGKRNKFFTNSGLAKKISRVITEIEPHIIHNHLISKCPIAVFEAIPADIPVIQTLHGPNFYCPTSWGNIRGTSEQCELGCGLKCVTKKCIPSWQYPLVSNLFSKYPKLLSKVTVFHCPSEYIEKISHRFGFTNTIRIPLGLREQFTSINNKRLFEGNKLLFIGSMHEVKGLDYLIDCMKDVLKVIPHVKLLVAGSGPQAEKYRNMAIETGLEDSVIFLGYVQKEQIVELYQSVDLTIVPSVWNEQFGMVGPESLACGVPVVATKVGGIPEWLKDEEFGLLVEPRNTEQLGTAIIQMLQDNARLEKYGKAASKYIQREHNIELYESRLLKLIEETCL